MLVLRDRFPATTTSSDVVHVNVDHILSALNIQLTQVGAWINVVGYTRKESNLPTMHNAPKQMACTVDAITVWSAGAIKLDEYETAVKDLQSA